MHYIINAKLMFEQLLPVILDIKVFNCVNTKNDVHALLIIYKSTHSIVKQ